MRLSTMWKVDSTIDAKGSSPIAERILECWAYDSGSIGFFRSSANFVYVFEIDGKRHFLRFADSSERTREAIEAEVDLLRWLAGTGISVACPVASADGNLVETVESGWGTFHAVVSPALDGAQFEIEELDHSGFRRWGAALGALHAALERYPRAGSAKRPTWRHHLESAALYLPDGARALRQELTEIASDLTALPQARDTYGLVHFDFELDNLVWRDDAIGILDMDDCSYLWYAADIAFALGDLFEENIDGDDARLLAFVQGYSEHRPVDEHLASRVPLFRRLGDLVKYARVVRAADLIVGPEHPEWLRDLSQRLEDRASTYRASIEGRRT